jgi:agmatine deiminase
MPPEWEPHARTWMAWPTVADDLDSIEMSEMRRAWANVANAIVPFEPVTMVVDPADVNSARSSLNAAVVLHEAALDDAWMRDMGPTFVRADDESLAAVNWVFNGWGQQDWAVWENDQLVAREVADTVGVPVISSPMVNEGGGLHVDGQGTVLLTETVQLDPQRNPGWTKARVEAELTRTIGAERFVWLERGLTRDYERFGTRGHVDILACFADPTTILFHDQRDPSHPDYAISQQIRATLAKAGPWRLIGLPAPRQLRDDVGWVDWSYINHYICNGAVVMCTFDDPNDAVVAELLREAYPAREIVPVDARAIFARGGGIHCITQQQPQ